MDPSWQPVTGAAQRRKGRRLRAAWRHEQQSIAQAWPRLPTTEPYEGRRRPEPGRRGTRTCTTRDGDRSPLLPSTISSACLRKSPAVPGHPAWVSRGGHSSGSSHTSWSSLPTSCPWLRSWICLLRWGWRDAGWGPAGGFARAPRQTDPLCRLSKCPRSESHPVVASCLSSALCPWSTRRQNSWWYLSPLCSGLPSRALTFGVQVGVPGGGGGLQSLHPGQDSTAFGGAERVYTPVPHGRGGRAGRGGLQGFSQEQNSAAFRGAVHVDIPVPQGRGGGGGLHGLRPGQGSSASSSMDCCAGSASQCGDHPLGYLSPSGVVAHSSSWSPAA